MLGKKPVMALLLSLLLTTLTVAPTFAAQPPLDTSTYWMATIGQPRRVDPSRAYDTASGELILNVYDTLVRFNETRILETSVSTPYNYTSINSFEGSLADRYTISADGLTWTFHIREGVKFQPWKDENGTIHSGDILTPEDVEYSFEKGLVQDQFGSPMWMFYLPLTGEHNSDAWDLDGDGALNATEAAAAAAVLKNVITRDDAARTVTFHMNFAFPRIAFLQILTQCWGGVGSKKMMKDYGCWDGEWDAYWTNWRRKPSNSYGPLDLRYAATNPKTGRPFCGNHPAADYPAMCGTGPYKFTYWNKATLEWRVDRFADYWRGWPCPGLPAYLETVIVRGIPEWTTRKMLFLSGDYDQLAVPRANMLELLSSEDPKSDPLPGIVCFRDISPMLAEDNLFFTFELAEGSPYMGTGKFPDGIPRNFFANTKVRQAFAYSIDFVTLLRDAWFNEASQPNTWWIQGLAPDYEDKTLAKYALNLTKVEELLKAATFTQDGVTKSVWEWGFTFTMLYNLGNDQRKICNELVINAIHSLNIKRPGLPQFKISNLGIDWPVYLDALEASTMPTYHIGWMADFADADNWARPYMHSLGDFSYFQIVDADPNYNTTHIDELIEEGIRTLDGPKREAIYKELQRLYHDLAPSIPIQQNFGRRWQKPWVKGFTYNAIYPGMPQTNYYYYIWKGWYTPPAPPPTATVGALLGSSVPITASFTDPVTGKPAAGFLVFIQQSLDNATWTNVGAAVTDNNGYVVTSVTPPLGTVQYRVNFTGYAAPEQASPGLLYTNAKYYEGMIANRSLSLILLPQIGTSVKVTTRAIEGVLTDALTPLATKADVTSLTTEVSSLRTKISSLEGTISTLTTSLYASIGIAVVAILIAIVSLTRKRGPSEE